MKSAIDIFSRRYLQMSAKYIGGTFLMRQPLLCAIRTNVHQSGRAASAHKKMGGTCPPIRFRYHMN